jgi:hypothetical protein
MSVLAASVDAYALTGDRLVASVAALVAFAGAVIGGWALARRTGRRGRTAAIVAGTAGLLVGALVVATADGGPGSGSGIVGGFVALVFGVVAVVLGVLARVRTRRDHPTRA